MFNNMCSELDRWTKIQKKMQKRESRRIRRKFVIQCWFWKDCSSTCLTRILRSQQKRQQKLKKKPKRSKESCNKFWTLGGSNNGISKIYAKRKNTSKVGKGSKQWRKSKEDVRPQKIMRKSTIPIKIRTPRVVTRHIPSKPQKDHSSKQDQERKEQSQQIK